MADCEDCKKLAEAVARNGGTFEAFLGFVYVDDAWKIAAYEMPTELDKRHLLATLLRQIADELDNDTPVPEGTPIE